MTPYKLSLWLCAISFFIGGTLWGLTNPSFVKTKLRASLSLVCREDWISKELLEHLKQTLNVEIEQTSFSSWSEYARTLANRQGKFDLVCAHSFLAKDLITTGWMDELNYSQLAAHRGLAPEFRELPFDPEEKYFLPLGWLLNGYVFSKNSKLPPKWSELWPQSSRKISMNYPDLELYARMQLEGIEVDPEKQGRYNRDPEGATKDFLKRLGGLHEHTQTLSQKDIERTEIHQASNRQIFEVLRKSFSEFKTLEDGSHVWFLLLGVGSHSAHKELSREVIDELLSPKSSNLLRKQNKMAHVLSHFNDSNEVPSELKAGFIRQFPLRNLRFPDMILEDVGVWENFVNRQLQENKLPQK